ncbi:putative serine protease HtrA [Phycisphaerae bacterium RAS1]|nr:putative serine protease HtrA [Phycisphaerae bacterium RAS1]
MTRFTRRLPALIAAALLSALPAGARAAADEALAFRHALQSMAPSIVRIDTVGGALPVASDGGDHAPSAPAFRVGDGPTTGVIWSEDGLIITSSFNFQRDPAVITVTLADGRRYVAKLLARDSVARLALLRIDASNLAPARRRAIADVRPAQWILTAGFGYGSSQPAISVGVVSALNRLSGLAVQLDAKTSPANYGGPAFDIDGQLIGICVPSAGRDEAQSAGVEWYDSGIGFAVTNDYIEQRIPRLAGGADIRRGMLGISFEADDPVVGQAAASGPARLAAGLKMVSIEGAAAQAAGLQEGDVLTHLDGQPIARLLQLRRTLARKAAGDEVTLTFLRDESSQSVRVRLMTPEELQPPESQPATAAASQPADADGRP